MLALVAGNVAAVDVAQTLLQADFPRSFQNRDRRRRHVGHLVVGVETADVPGSLGPKFVPDESRDAAELVVSVHVAGNTEGRHLDPDAELFHQLQVVQDGLQSASHDLAVVLFAPSFQIHVDSVKNRRNVAQRLLGNEAVGHKHIQNVVLHGENARVVGVLVENRGLGVGVGDGFAVVPHGQPHHFFGQQGLAGSLLSVAETNHRNVRVLAELAAEVAAHCGQGKRTRARVHVEERLFLDRIHVHSDGLAVNQCVQRSTAVLANPTDADLSVFQHTVVGAETTHDLVSLKPLVEHRLFHRLADSSWAFLRRFHSSRSRLL